MIKIIITARAFIVYTNIRVPKIATEEVQLGRNRLLPSASSNLTSSISSEHMFTSPLFSPAWLSKNQAYKLDVSLAGLSANSK